jgi:hypothetical protein
MRRRPTDADPGDGSPESDAEELAQRFLQKHPRFFLFLGLGLAVLVAIGLILALV